MNTTSWPPWGFPPSYDIRSLSNYPNKYTMPNNQIVDIAGFITDNLLPFANPLHKQALPLLLPPHHLLLLWLGTITATCLLIPDHQIWFPRLWLPHHFLFHRWPPVLVGFTLGIILKQTPWIASTISRQFLRNGGGELPIFLSLSRPQRQRTIFSSDTTDGSLTRGMTRMYRVHQG